MADLADEYSEVLKVAIEDHIVQSQDDVIEDLDAEKFISWLKSELEVGRYMFSNAAVPMRYIDHCTETIGLYKINRDVSPHREEALITPEVFGSYYSRHGKRTLQVSELIRKRFSGNW